MTTTKIVVGLVIILSIVTYILGIYYQSEMMMKISIAVIMIVVICSGIIVVIDSNYIQGNQQQKSEDESLSEDEDLILQEKEDLEVIHEPIVFPSETAQIINEFIKENTSESAPIGPSYLTMIVINKARSLNYEDAVETVLIEIIQTLNNEIVQMRTEKINLNRAREKILDKYLGKELKKYKKLEVITSNNTE
jgi:hypothetical protein